MAPKTLKALIQNLFFLSFNNLFVWEPVYLRSRYSFMTKYSVITSLYSPVLFRMKAVISSTLIADMRRHRPGQILLSHNSHSFSFDIYGLIS